MSPPPPPSPAAKSLWIAAGGGESSTILILILGTKNCEQDYTHCWCIFFQGQIDVFYSDFGNADRIPLAEAKCLHPSLYNFPTQAIQCRLHGVFRRKVGVYRADSRFAPSQWETALLCNAVSHWLGASRESALHTMVLSYSHIFICLSVGPTWTKFNQIWIRIQIFFFLVYAFWNVIWKKGKPLPKPILIYHCQWNKHQWNLNESAQHFLSLKWIWNMFSPQCAQGWRGGWILLFSFQKDAWDHAAGLLFELQDREDAIAMTVEDLQDGNILILQSSGGGY